MVNEKVSKAGIPENQHILDAMGILTEQEAERLSQEVRRGRDEEWTQKDPEGLSITETERKAIERLYTETKEKLDVARVILFGSKARGEAKEYSDVDLIVLTRRTKTKADRWILSDIAAEINVDQGVALDCLYFDEEDWNSGDDINPELIDNVRRDGIVLF